MRDQLGDDAHRNLGHRLRPDVEAQWCVNAAQSVAGNPVAQQVVEDQADLPAAADHADKAGRRFCQEREGLFIMVMSAGHDNAEGVLVDSQPAQRLIEQAHEKPFGEGKPLGVAVLLAVVDDPDVEVGVVSQLGHLLADVAPPDDHQAGTVQTGEIRDARQNVSPRTLGQRFHIRQQVDRQGVAATMGDDCSVLVHEPTIGRRAMARWLRIKHDGLREAPPFRNACREDVIVADVVARADGVDQHLHPASADQAVVPAIVVVKVERDNLGPPLIEKT